VLLKAAKTKLQEIGKMDEDQFDFPTNLWVNILIDFAVAYRDKICNREELLDSLIPIYMGKTLSFVKKQRGCL